MSWCANVQASERGCPACVLAFGRPRARLRGDGACTGRALESGVCWRGHTRRSRSSPERSVPGTEAEASSSAWCARREDGAYFSPAPPRSPLRLLPLPASSPRTLTAGPRTEVNEVLPMVSSCRLESTSPVGEVSTGRSPRTDAIRREHAPTESKRADSAPADGEGEGPVELPASLVGEVRAVLPASRVGEGEGKGPVEILVSHVGEVPVDHPASWVGGVRALRDCSVRLVRRQLRHIARLNRTLDRALTAAP